jgi:septum formation protein
MTSNILFLGSTSAARKELLTAAGIPFRCIPINADESLCDWSLPLQKLVESIAVYKMAHVQLPAAQEGDSCFVLTADTLSVDSQGVISGKPASRDEARIMLKAARDGMRTATAFCLEKYRYQDGTWQSQERMVQCVEAGYLFSVPDKWLEWYLDTSRGLKSSGAIAIEDLGGLFLQEVTGSYTTIVGLPMVEVRLALEKMGFFSV